MSRSQMCRETSHDLCAMTSCLCSCHVDPKAVERASRRLKRERERRAQLKAAPPVTRPARTCPVCGEPPGEGFMTYCSTEHMFQGSARQ